jgi:hypothetical protein
MGKKRAILFNLQKNLVMNNNNFNNNKHKHNHKNHNKFNSNLKIKDFYLLHHF